MKIKSYLFIFFLLGISTALFAQTSQTKTLSGYIYDQKTGESLIGVSVFDENSKTSSSSNEYGFYSLTLEAGKHSILFSYLGYEKTKSQIDLSKNVTLTLRMKETDSRATNCGRFGNSRKRKRES